MKNLNLLNQLIIIVALLFSCTPEKKELSIEEITRNYIEAINKGDSAKIDSLTSDDFKVFSDSTSTEKTDFLNSLNKPEANAKINIAEVSIDENIVRTTESISDDVINILELDPIIKKKEYHFDDTKLIKSVYNMELIESPEYMNIQKYFVLWAYQEYPDFVNKMIEKAKNKENIDEERRYLLTKLKSAGLDVLEPIKNELQKKTEAVNTPKPKTTTRKSIYVNPDSSFLNSYVVTYFGQNAFPFGERTVQEFKNEVAATVMSNGNNPKIKGWTKNDNVYTLHTEFKDGNIQFIFEHMLNRDGKISHMRGKVKGLPIDGVNMYRFVPTLTE